MLSIKADFDFNDIDKIIQQETQAWFNELLEDYRTAGKKFVEMARSKTKVADGSFGNITWNLRSSIGYLLVNNGQVIESYFPTLNGATEGSETGDNYAKEIALLVDEGEGVSLICVAGMEYAYFVESKGYEVISTSSDQFANDIRQMLAA